MVDPVSQVSAAALITSFFTSSVGVSVSLAVGSAALSLVLAPSAPKGLSGASGRGSNSQGVRGSVKQAAPAQRIVFGQTRFGGAFYFYKAVPPYLYVGHVHSVMPITSFDELFVGDVKVPLDAAGDPIAAPYLVGTSTPRLRAGSQDGLLLTQVRNPILDAITTLDANFRLPGQANTVYRFDYGADFDEYQSLWGQVQVPDPQWAGKGAPVYDPRDPSQILPTDINDAADLQAAIATWKYSNTAALVQAHWAMMPYGLNAGTGRIRWDEVAAAADFDEESVPAKSGGVVKRHTIDGVVSLDVNPLGVMEDMLTANRGFVSPRGGSVTVSSSQPRAPRMTIVDDMILGGFSYRDRRPKRDLANVVRGKFVSSERDHKDADLPTLERTDLVTGDGELLEISINLPFTSRHETGQRLMKNELDATRLGRVIAGVFDLRVLGLVEGDVCNVWSDLFPALNGTYEVIEWTMSDDLVGVSLSLAEYDPDLPRAWTAATDEQDFTIEVEDV